MTHSVNLTCLDELPNLDIYTSLVVMLCLFNIVMQQKRDLF